MMSAVSRFRAWVHSLGRQNTPEVSGGKVTTADDKLSTTTSEPVVRAVREPYPDSPDHAEFLRAHHSYATARLICVHIEVIGAPGVGARSLVNKLIYDDMKNGGQRRYWDEYMMVQTRVPYFFGGKIYDLDVFANPYPPVANPQDGLQNAKGKKLPGGRKKHDNPGYAGPRRHQSVVFAYDITSRVTFDELVSRFDHLVAHYSQGYSASPIVILGLKSDLEDKREVSRTELSHFATSHGCLSGECSAVSGLGVDEIFSELTETVHFLRKAVEEKTGHA